MATIPKIKTVKSRVDEMFSSHVKTKVNKLLEEAFIAGYDLGYAESSIVYNDRSRIQPEFPNYENFKQYTTHGKTKKPKK